MFRPELVDLLEQSTRRKLTVLSAPAGSGKSTLLRDWAAQSTDNDVAIASVWREQRDPQQFWLSLLNAIRADQDDVPAPALTPMSEFDPQSVIELLLEEISNSSKPFVLVIDDLQELQAPEAFEQLEQLLSRLPAGSRVVLSGRRDPPLRLHQYRLDGQLAEIRAADLAFDQQDGRALLDAAGIDMPEPALDDLLARTEGWAAGLRLAALALQGSDDPATFVDRFSGSDRTVSEYLLAEVLDRQPDDVRLLLLRTSILDGPITGELADAVADSQGAEQILHQLESANAFVVAVGRNRRCFRYHHLFQDLLRLELRRTRPQELRELHSRAARWHAANAQTTYAIRHAQQAEDWELAGQLLANGHLNMMLDGQHALIHELLSEFPQAVRDADLSLTLVAVFDELEQGSLDAAAALLAVIDARIDTMPEERRATFDVARAVAGLVLARRRGDFTNVVAQVCVLSQPPATPTHAVAVMSDELRVLALLNLGIAEIWSFQVEQAGGHLEAAAAVAKRINRPYLELQCLTYLGVSSQLESLARARERNSEALELAEEHGWSTSPVLAPALTSLGMQLIWSGEYKAAAERLEQAAGLLRADGEPAPALVWHFARGNLYAAHGDWPAALREYRTAERMQSLFVGTGALTPQVTGFRIVAQIKLGRLDQAEAAFEEIDTEDNPAAESLVALGMLRYTQRDWQGAVDAVAPVLEARAPTLGKFTTIEAFMVAASALVELADRRGSERAVENALALAEADRMIFPFAIMPGVELLQRHPRHATAHAELLNVILDVLGGGKAGDSDATVPVLTDPLSAGELRVLGYLASNLSAIEIASELVVSVNTVKTHMRHIYAKLGAHTRSEAVDTARRVGLLGRGVR